MMRETILITCRGTVTIIGKHNHLDEIFGTEEHTPLGQKYYLLSVAKTLHQRDIIATTNIFCVNFVSYDDKDAVVRLYRHQHETLDKFMLAGFTKTECDKIDCPRIKEAVGYVACEVIQVLEIEDHALFVGKIVDSHLSRPNAKRLFHIDGEEYTTTLN